MSLPRHGFLWADQSVIYQERQAHAVQIGETESTQAAGLVGGDDGAVAQQEAVDGETKYERDRTASMGEVMDLIMVKGQGKDCGVESRNPVESRRQGIDSRFCDDREDRKARVYAPMNARRTLNLKWTIMSWSLLSCHVLLPCSCHTHDTDLQDTSGWCLPHALILHRAAGLA